MNSIDKAIKDIYSKRYPINHIAKGNMDSGACLTPLEYIVNYAKEVLEEISTRATGKESIKIVAYGLRNHIDEVDEKFEYRLEKDTLDLAYMTYEVVDASGYKETFDKDFYVHQLGTNRDYWSRGVHLYIAPIVSDSIMHRKPDGSGVLTRFRREKQILTPLNEVMIVNGVKETIRISFNEKPFKLIVLHERDGFKSKTKSPTILMTIYAKGLDHVLKKYYNCSIDDFALVDLDNSNTTKMKDERYSIVKDVKSNIAVVCLNDHKLHQLATAILHVVKQYASIMEQVTSGLSNSDWEQRSMFLLLLVGKSIFNDTCPISTLSNMMDRQEVFISAYMVNTVKIEFNRIGYDFNDIYDYYATVFYEYDNILHNNVIEDSIKDKRIESYYYMYSNIINKINKEYEHALKDLETNKTKSAIKRLKGTIFRNTVSSKKSGMSLAIYQYSAIGDAFPLTMANVTSLQESGNGNEKNLSVVDIMKDSIKDVEPHHLLLGNAYFISNSAVNPILTHNIHCSYLEDGTPIFDRKVIKKLASKIGKLQA